MLRHFTIKHSRIFLTCAALGLLSLFLFIFLPHPALAQQAQLQALGDSSILPQTNLILIIARLIRAFLGVVGIILTILVIYAGFVYMTSQGDATKIEKSKNTLKRAGIGLIIIFASFTITHFVIQSIINGAFTGGGINRQNGAERYQEPRSGSLGYGIIEDHYPERGAIDIARNTMVFVTFKEAINPASLIQGFGENDQATALNDRNVLIYETAQGQEAKLVSTQVKVSVDASHKTFLFDPEPLLGNPLSPTNYTIFLSPDIEKEQGGGAFVGRFRSGYEWTFTVSTVVDLTPPQVVSVIPVAESRFDRNIAVEMTFNEPMNPIAASGVYDPEVGESFENASVVADGNRVTGDFELSNHYRTLTFTPKEVCGQDPCGGKIFCLPGGADLSVTARAALLGNEPPQAIPIDGRFDGFVDSAANSLDGNADGVATGPLTDSYTWEFETTDQINTTLPEIVSIEPAINQGEVDVNAPISFVFNTLMSARTARSANVQLWPEPFYEMSYRVSKEDTLAQSTIALHHPTLIPPEEDTQFYWPLVNNGLRSSYQMCFFPSVGPTCAANTDAPFCCNGIPSSQRCRTGVGDILDS